MNIKVVENGELTEPFAKAIARAKETGAEQAIIKQDDRHIVITYFPHLQSDELQTNLKYKFIGYTENGHIFLPLKAKSK